MRFKSAQVAKETESSNAILRQGLMLFPVTAESARGIMLPALTSLQNLSDKDKTLAASPLAKDSKLPVNGFSHSPPSSKVLNI